MSGSPSHRAVRFSLGNQQVREQLDRYQDQVAGVPGDLVLAWARRAVESAPARGVSGTLIVRSEPVPGLAVVGSLDDAAMARVGELFEHVEEMLTTLRYVSYGRAERDVERLADRLSSRFSAAMLDAASFRAIPRGGHIVLGMLSLAMGLRHEQLLDGPTDRGQPVVLVDDCALTGHRVHQALAREGAEQVALAVLYAVPELLTRIEAAEGRMVGCVAAEHLRDLGPEWFGDDYPAWQQRWAAELGADRYWVGRPETIAFAWKEPDRSFVNAATGTREEGWKLMPPELCFAPGASPSPVLRLQEQPTGPGPIRASEELFFATIDGRTVLVLPDADEAIELDPVASAMFQSVQAHGTIEAAAAELTASFDVSPPRLRADLQTFSDQLLEMGALTVDPTAAAITSPGDARGASR